MCNFLAMVYVRGLANMRAGIQEIVAKSDTPPLTSLASLASLSEGGCRSRGSRGGVSLARLARWGVSLARLARGRVVGISGSKN